jgi:UPF0148 protein
MATDDEIMAQYLLKGGKMLAKTCQKCGSPLFEYKGETFCVVCRERGVSQESAKGQPAPTGAAVQAGQNPPAIRIEGRALGPALEAALVSICARIEHEPDPERVLILMRAVKTGVSVLSLLSQR